MYEFNPAAGVKVRRIVMLADDLAMALRAVSVRILAPIPGESVVGIEIPNPRRETVYLREVIESESYRAADSKITLALGKDIGGMPFATDLAKMPHLSGRRRHRHRQIGVDQRDDLEHAFQVEPSGRQIHHGRPEDARIDRL